MYSYQHRCKTFPTRFQSLNGRITAEHVLDGLKAQTRNMITDELCLDIPETMSFKSRRKISRRKTIQQGP